MDEGRPASRAPRWTAGTRLRRLRPSIAGVVAALALAVLAWPGLAGGQGARAPSHGGAFGPAFEEPTISGRRTDEDCIKRRPRNAAERRIAASRPWPPPVPRCPS